MARASNPVAPVPGSAIRDPGSRVGTPGVASPHGNRIPDPGPRTPDPGPRNPARDAAAGRVAIIHDWLTGMRGGEKVLEAVCALYPDATIYTLLQVPGTISPRITRHSIHTSPVQWVPGARHWYRQLLPLFPSAVELFDLDEYDLIISSSHCVAKSVIGSARAAHVCYCHSPMRYAWDQFSAYFGPELVGPMRSGLLRHIMAGLARWDRDTAGRVDRFLANSQYVAGRIRRYYNRGSTVVYPPVDTDFYHPSDGGRTPDPSFLVVSGLVPYKRVDVAVEACRRAGVPLKIVGRGPEEARLRKTAGPGVEFLGWRSDEEVRDLYRGATAVLLPGIEDFGLVPVEAQACGTPVVALRRGGACETVLDGVTGILVDEDSAGAFATGLSRVCAMPHDPAAIRRHAERFSRERFMQEFQAAIASMLTERSDPR